MKNRSGPEAAVLRASVALMFLGGRSHHEIAEACAITPCYSQFIVSILRKQGMDLPRRTRGSRPARRDAPDRDDVLDAWADGMMARDIALLTRRSLGSVKEIVRRARLRGDARATRHPRWPEPSVILRAA